MITINFEAATGTDLRKEMLDLLGISDKDTSTTKGLFWEIKPRPEDIEKEATSVDQTEVQLKSTTEETAKPEQVTRKRRNKAEIETALAANTGTEEPPVSIEDASENEVNGTVETLIQDNTEQNTITSDDLIRMAVAIGRCGGKDLTLGLLKADFKEATISKKDGKPQLTPEQYPAVAQGFQKIASDIYPNQNEDNRKALKAAGFNFEG